VYDGHFESMEFNSWCGDWHRVYSISSIHRSGREMKQSWGRTCRGSQRWKSPVRSRGKVPIGGGLLWGTWSSSSWSLFVNWYSNFDVLQNEITQQYFDQSCSCTAVSIELPSADESINFFPIRYDNVGTHTKLIAFASWTLNISFAATKFTQFFYIRSVDYRRFSAGWLKVSPCHTTGQDIVQG